MKDHRRVRVRALAALLAAGLVLGGLLVVGDTAAAQMTGFGASAAEAQRRAERLLIDAIQPPLLQELNRDLSREPHVAGGEAQGRVRDYLVRRLGEWGLEPEVATYEIYLPWPTEVSLAVLQAGTGSNGRGRREFTLREETVATDPTTALEQYPWVNGYSGAGSVEAEVVYVNYGLHEDYALLDAAGVDVRGKVALARYGRSFRGIKARLAEEHGAAGLIMYSDPADDGYVRGDVYPEGPFRSESAVQRGSVIGHWGDPTTPGWASVKGAERLDPHRVGGPVPSIPVIPLNWGAAREILAGIRNAPIPSQDWQGALPVRYHVGPGPVRVAMTVRHDDGYKDIHDVLAVIEGTDYPDEMVVVGGHIDSWNAGSGDNVSGTSSVMAAARAFAELGRQGIRPRRTVVFAGWDAEEWGIIGSTEWVEEHAETLRKNGVAYLNQDGAAGGPSFGGSGSPSLKSFLAEAAGAVPHHDGGTLEEAWRTQQGVGAGEPLSMGDLGGGSDFAGFYNHVGVPSLGFGFGGGSGIGHSAYDTHEYMSRLGDPGFLQHTTTSRLAAVAALRMANATLLPYDYERFGSEMAELVVDIAADVRTDAERDAIAGLAEAFRRLQAAGRILTIARERALRDGIGQDAAERANRALIEVERAMTRDQGLVKREWFKNLLFAADYDNGYATIAVPSVREAVRAGDAARTVLEAQDLTDRVDAAVAHVIAAITEMR
ncbi:MAG: M20/M25/M40 family metallo-hydrolase [Longimicrobiales bacterium]